MAKQVPRVDPKNGPLCFINGELVPSNQAKLCVFDRLFLYGDGIFEGVAVYNGKILRLDEHLDRLYDSAKYLHINIPMSREELVSAILQVVQVNKLETTT